MSLADIPERAIDFSNAVSKSPFHRFVGNSERHDLTDGLAERVAPHIADKILEMIKQDSGMEGLRSSDQLRGARQVLFDSKGALLGDESKRSRLLAVLKEAAGQKLIATNALSLFYSFYAAITSRLDVDSEKAKEVGKDHELILAIWEAATSHEIQPRSLGSLLPVRKKMMEVTGIVDLPLKEWMPEEDSGS